MSWIIEEEVIDYRPIITYIAYTKEADVNALKSANAKIEELKKAYPNRIYKLRKYS